MSRRVSTSRLVKVFTPSFADEGNRNAQNLTVKEVVARLDPARFRVTMFQLREPDPRIAARANTQLWQWGRAGTARTLLRMLPDVPDIYFFPREGPLDRTFLQLKRWLRWHTAVVTYIVSGGLDRLPPRPGQLRNLRAASAVYGNCQYLTGLLINKLGFEAQTIYDGVDRRYYFPPASRNGRPPDRLTVLYAGSFRPYKRADIVVRQAARWPRVQFRLCGRGEEEESCRRLAASLDCRNVEFLGELGQAALGEEMRNADVFLFPSELEGHPQVLLQAAASGLPCVARDSYHPDAVLDGRSGFLVSNEEELGHRLEQLLRDASLRSTMVKAAAEHSTMFDWDRVAADWAHAFEKVAGQNA